MTDKPERVWWAERGFVLSAIFLGVVVLAAIAIFARGDSGDGARATAAHVSTPRGRPVETGGSMCGLPVGNTDKPVGPPATTWKLVGRLAVPTRPDIGPGVEQGHRHVCFAHNPTGALFAAVWAMALVDAYGGDLPLMREVLAETKARNYLLRSNADYPRDPFFRVEVDGFRVAIASPDLVTVDLVLRTPDSAGRVAVVAPMRWEQRKTGGDWHFMITNPEQPYSGGPVTGTDYVPWSGA